MIKFAITAWVLWFFLLYWVFGPLPYSPFSSELSLHRVVIQSTASTDYHTRIVEGSEHLVKAYADQKGVDFSGVVLVGKSYEEEFGVQDFLTTLHYRFVVEGKVIGYSDKYKEYFGVLVPIFEVTQWRPAEYIPRIEHQYMLLSMTEKKIFLVLFVLTFIVALILTYKSIQQKRKIVKERV